MAVELIKIPKKILRMSSQDCDLSDVEDLKRLERRIKDVMQKNPRCQGLSAVQVGERKRMFVTREKGRERTFVNPTVKWQFLMYNSAEMCASCNDWWVVKRPRIIKVEYYDVAAVKHTRIFFGKRARVFMHEIDHFEGKMLCDIGTKWYGSELYERIRGKIYAR